MPPTIRKISPDVLFTVWPKVRAGLEIVVKHANDGWLPEDVYMAIKGGNALLFMWEDDSFVVVNIMQSYSGAQELHVWTAYGEGHVGGEYSPVVDQLAKELGCGAITFFSPRRGWAKNKLGYTEVHTLYRKELI
jgi:hypothetical protein